jgi:DNA polymerase-3 subunit alpha
VSEALNSQGFVHLRVRSAYSLLEGAIKAGKVPKMAADAGMPAVAVADRVNLFGALEFSQAAKDAGVQPIVACAMPVTGIGGQASTTAGPRSRPWSSSSRTRPAG